MLFNTMPTITNTKGTATINIGFITLSFRIYSEILTLSGGLYFFSNVAPTLRIWTSIVDQEGIWKQD